MVSRWGTRRNRTPVVLLFISDLGELRWYAGRRFSRDAVLGTVTMSQQAVAEKLIAKFGVSVNKDAPIMVVGMKFEEFDCAEPDVEGPLRSLVDHLLWGWLTRLAREFSTRYGPLRGVLMRRSGCTAKRRCTIVMYNRSTNGFGVTFQRFTEGGMSLGHFVDLDFASKAIDRCPVCGVVVIVCPSGCVSFLSRAQKSVTL